MKQAAPLLLSSTVLGLVTKYKLGNTGIPYLTHKNINTRWTNAIIKVSKEGQMGEIKNMVTRVIILYCTIDIC